MLVPNNFHTRYISEALLGSIIAAGASAAGAGVSAGVSSTANRRAFKWSKKMYDIQRADYLSDREYNSPENQMARFRAAGLNPNLIYGQMNDQGFGPSMPSLQPDSSAAYISDNFSKLANTVGLYEKMRQDEKQREVMDAQITESQAREAYYNALANRTATLQGIDALKFGAYSRGSFFDHYVKSQILKNAGIDLNNRFLDASFRTRLGILNQNLLFYKLRNEGLGYDNRLKSGIMKVDDFWINDYWRNKLQMPSFVNRKLNLDIDLSEARKELFKEQKDLYDARAKYTDIKKMLAPLGLLIDLIK